MKRSIKLKNNNYSFNFISKTNELNKKIIKNFKEKNL